MARAVVRPSSVLLPVEVVSRAPRAASSARAARLDERNPQPVEHGRCLAAFIRRLLSSGCRSPRARASFILWRRRAGQRLRGDSPYGGNLFSHAGREQRTEQAFPLSGRRQDRGCGTRAMPMRAASVAPTKPLRGTRLTRRGRCPASVLIARPDVHVVSSCAAM